jgi:hypothetical protein
LEQFAQTVAAKSLSTDVMDAALSDYVAEGRVCAQYKDKTIGKVVSATVGEKGVGISGFAFQSSMNRRLT